jgi:hypothetical protein
MAMAGMMMVLMMVLTITLLGSIAHLGSSGLVGHSDNVLRSGRQRANALVAQSLAESGIRLTVEWLNNGNAISNSLVAGPPNATGTSFYGANQVNAWDKLCLNIGGATGTMSMRLYPYTKNATNNRRIFVAEAIGEYLGVKQVVRTVITEKTFARYAFFSDTCPVNWWVQENTFFNGPVHVNGSNSTGTGVDSAAALNILWKSASTQKIFGFNGSDSFTTSLNSSQIKWNKDAAGTLTTPTGGQWSNIMGTGSAPATGKPRIKMPTQSGKQYVAALAGTGEPSTATGVKIPTSDGQTTGGIFIKGPVDRIKLSASGTNNTVQGMEIYQTEGTTQTRTIVTINPNTNTTTIQKDTKSGTAPWVTGAAISMNGTTNGVVYSTGDINSLSGVVANNVMSGTEMVKSNDMTIVTDAAKSMKIDGGVVYANLASNLSDPNNPRSDASAATTESGTLGLVSRNIQIKEFTPTGAPLTDVSVHATVMAYDTFDAANPRNVTDPVTGVVTPGRAPGNFKLLGGYIAKNNGTFGQVGSDSTLLAGFRVNRNYDQRAADNPPPFFPSEENSFQVTSFQRVGAPLQP